MNLINNLEPLHFEIVRYLGHGANAQVKLAIYNGQKVAAKILNPTHGKDEAKSEQEFYREIAELKRISHKNIIKLIAFGKYRENNDLLKCILTEYADLGSLAHVLNESDYNYTEGHAISWMYQCSDAINYLHSRKPKPMLHRDLKPLNLLLMKGGTVLKVCDFGTASDLKTIMTFEKGSPCWVAPEVLDQSNKTYDEKCDVYSYAIIVWEIICRLKPYFHLNNQNANSIMYGVFKGSIRPKPIANCPKILSLVCERGMDRNANKRPSMELIFNIMKQLDSIINTKPIEPIVPYNEEEIDSNESISSKYFGSAPQLSITKSPFQTVFNNNRSNTIVDSGLENSGPPKVSTQFSESLKPNPRGATHKRSISHGSNMIVPKIDKEKMKKDIDYILETMLYEPLVPLIGNQESLLIYQMHKELIQEDEKLQKEVNSLKQQKSQLEQTLQNINSYNELLKQKNLLLSENSRLKTANKN